MEVHWVPAFNDNYIWLICDRENRSLFCVDPGDARPVRAFLSEKQYQLKGILLTHHHADHTDGVNALLKAHPNTPVYGPDDRRIPEVTDVLTENQRIHLDGLALQVLSTPGHTATHISLYAPHFGWLFCGDTLFSAGCGRVFDGTMQALFHSLQKLKALPEQTKVFCAHEYTRQNLRFAATVEPDNEDIKQYSALLQQAANSCSLPSTIGLEKAVNPFFRTQTPTVKHYALQKGCQGDSFSVFQQIRADKDQF
ncbi:MAG: hydroxyacylglutathione hydrolase [Tatlockia sp.]|jgi:hydroxyacylglutathione hydrolase